MNCFNQQCAGMTDISATNCQSAPSWQNRSSGPDMSGWQTSMMSEMDCGMPPATIAPAGNDRMNNGGGMNSGNRMNSGAQMDAGRMNMNMGNQMPSGSMGMMPSGTMGMMPSGTMGMMPSGTMGMMPATMGTSQPVSFAMQMDNGMFPLAMSYVPMQQWSQPSPLEEGFRRGTMFKELDLPFLMGRCR